MKVISENANKYSIRQLEFIRKHNKGSISIKNGRAWVSYISHEDENE